MRAIRLGMGVAAVLTVAVASTAFCAEPKIAVVDMERALKEFNRTALAETELRRQQQEVNDKIESMRSRHAAIQQTFESVREQARNKALSETAKQSKLEEAETKLMELKEYEGEMLKYAEDGNRQLLEQKLRMLKDLRDRIREAVGTYAKARGVTVVLDSSQNAQQLSSPVVYSDSVIDITDKIIQILNR